MWIEGYTGGEICEECDVSKPTALKYRPDTEARPGEDVHDELRELVHELRQASVSPSDASSKDIEELQEDIAKLKHRVNQLRTCLLSGNQWNEQATYCPHCKHPGFLTMRHGKYICTHCGRHVMPPLKEKTGKNE
ncbi:MAG: hypothetical protein ACP5FL_06250 [Thermoplasmatota archaeon]